MKAIVLSGRKFGRLTALAEAGRSSDRQVLWLCRCECGKETTVRSGHLRSGRVQSCGCYWLERMHDRATHEMSKTNIYRVWRTMHSRCENPKQKSFPYYGGRGITVCSRWSSFENFFEDMGSTYNDGLTIERMNVDGDYEPSNCRWATDKEQANNTSRNHYVMGEGMKLTLAEVSEKYGIKYDTLKRRIYRGWTLSEAVAGRRNK